MTDPFQLDFGNNLLDHLAMLISLHGGICLMEVHAEDKLRFLDLIIAPPLKV